MKNFTEKSYQNVIDFIDASVDSGELMDWLVNLERLPDNLRANHLAQMKTKMLSNKEPDKIIDVMDSINDRDILSAINLVVKDIHDSGMRTKKYLQFNNNENFNILVSLLAASI